MAYIADRADRNEHWFALQVRSRHEHAIALMLQNKGYEMFLPTYRSRRVWSDRVTELVCRSLRAMCLPGFRCPTGLFG